MIPSQAQPESTNGAVDSHIATALLSAGTITGTNVCNLQQKNLGEIHEIMLDLDDGRIRYAVLSSGGFLGMGDRLFAVPWRSLKGDLENKRFILDMDVERLKKAPGFNKDEWPNMADASWHTTVESYYA